MSTELSRRNFLAGAATLSALAGAAALVGCGSSTTAADAGAAEATTADATAWLGAAPGIAEFADEQTADVVVVGAGTGGMFAAAAAAEGGASVIVIEKGEDYGSVKDDLGAVNTKLQQEDGTTFDRAQMMLDYYRYSNARTDLRLFNAWFDNSAETVDWFTDLIAAKGVTMWHEAAVGDQEGLVAHWATGHSPAWPEDKDKKINGATVLGEYIQGLGGQIVFSTPMVELAVENGKVTGVVAQNADGGYVKYNASKGVVVATGGYAKNDEMMGALQPETLKMISSTWAPPTNTGDGIKACIWAGAAFDQTHSSMLFDRAAIATDALSGTGAESSMFWMGSQPWLKVNLNGERFTNEGTGVYDWILHSALNQPGNTYCTVFDSNWKTYAEQFVMHGCSRLFPFENGAPSNHDTAFAQSQIDKLTEKGMLVQADTLEELAKGLGLPEETFVATVERYNELADAGVDEDFGKEGYRLSKLDTAPYFGVRQSGSLLATMDGIRINAKCQALREDGTVIEGLYVTGNDSGCYFDRSYINQANGAAAGRTVTFGRMIGKELAAL